MFTLFTSSVLSAADSRAVDTRRAFDVPAGAATDTLPRFGAQAGDDLRLLYASADLAGVRTGAIRGLLAPREALEAMTRETTLSVVYDPESDGLMLVRRAGTPAAPGARTRGPGLVAGLLALATAAGAQPAADVRGDAPIALPEFTVSSQQPNAYNARDAISASRIQSDLLSTPASISVATREFIDTVAPVRVFDAIRYSSGVTEGSSPYLGDRVTLRGFSATRIFIDGILNPAVNNTDSAILERVEVLKGPNAILAPSGLAGGTVNMVTKSPSFRPTRTISATVGLFDAQRAEADLGGVAGDKRQFAWRFVGVAQDSDRMVDEAKLQQLILFPSLTWRNDRFSVTAKVNYTNSEATTAQGLPIDPAVGSGENARALPGLGREFMPGEASTGRVVERLTYSLTATGRLTSWLSTRLFYQHADIDNTNDTSASLNVPTGGQVNPRTGLYTPFVAYGNAAAGFAPLPNPPAQIVRSAVLRRGTLQFITFDENHVQNDYVAVLPLGSLLRSTTVFGWEYTALYNVRTVRAGNTTALDLDRPAYGAPITYGAPTQRASSGERTRRAFVLERLHLFEDRLNIDLGAQHTDTRSRSVDQLTGTRSYERQHTPTYSAAGLFKVLPTASVYASYSENASGVSTGVANAPLVFRRGEQYEVGAKLEFFQRRLAVNLAWFDITLTNFQLNNPEASFNPLAPRFLLTDLTSDGWEVEVIGSLTEDLSVVGSVSRSKARDVFGRPERGAPDEAAAVLFDYRFRRFGWKGLSASVGVAHTGRRSGDTATAITAAGVPQQPTFWLASNTIVNLGAAFVHGPMTYRLLVDNALDKTYIGTAASRGGLDYGMERNVRLTASYRF